MPDEPSGGLGLTSLRDLVVAALSGAFVGWLVLATYERFAGQPAQLPWVGPLVLIFLAALVGGLAYTTHRRIQVRRERIEPERAVTFLAFGKASALGGAAIAGGYLAWALMALGNLSAEGPQQRLVRGLVATVAGVGIALAGMALERACRIPDGDDPDDDLKGDEPGADEPA